MAKLVQIIIPVHNRPDHTKQTLESLFKNTNPELFDLYVIDDGSKTDSGVYAYLRTLWHEKYPLFQLHHKDEATGPAHTRKETVKWIQGHQNQGKYLYHSDNDVYFKPGWLEELISTYEYLQNSNDPGFQKIKLLGGGCHPYLQNNSELYLGGKFSNYNIGLKDAISGYSQFMTWETWDKYGPFDEGNKDQPVKIMGSEDWAFCQRIIKDGGLVGSLQPELVIHTGKTNTYGKPATGVETFGQSEGVLIK